MVAQQQPVSFRSWRSRRLISGNGSWHGIHLPHGRMAFPVTASLRAPCYKWQSGGVQNVVTGCNEKSVLSAHLLDILQYSSLKVIYCAGAITLHGFIMTLLNMCPPPQTVVYQHACSSPPISASPTKLCILHLWNRFPTSRQCLGFWSTSGVKIIVCEGQQHDSMHPIN